MVKSAQPAAPKERRSDIRERLEQDILEAAKRLGGSIQDLVSGLARECADQGHRAFVCSPHEVKSLKQMIPAGYFVTPGVRPAGGDKGDQVRIETPAQAALNGASSLVVGRPILEAIDPLGFALQMQKEFLTEFEP